MVVAPGLLTRAETSPLDEHECYGHIKRNCPEKDKSSKSGKKAKFVLVADARLTGGDDAWIIDSGASRRLVGNEDSLINATTCAERCKMADGEWLTASKRACFCIE
ncbi:unnamed protein product [Phytophthora fragariaefolia]|uniref:Unnamed protein product n=1 Tax=Phytophthora fragariaefolia TaxID=1490495 RepID=A0A9W6XAF0_9STRA|nr:unnamed protein product [Phytophthora fragariaefolia]